VRNLDLGLLLGIDVLGPKEVIINISKRSITLLYCENTTVIIIIQLKTNILNKPKKIIAYK